MSSVNASLHTREVQNVKYLHTFVFKTDLNTVAAMVEIRITGGRMKLNCSEDSATKNRPPSDMFHSNIRGGTYRNSGLSIGRMAAKTRLSSKTRLIIGQYGWRGLRLLVEYYETRKTSLSEPKRLPKHESFKVVMIVVHSSFERVFA